MRLDFHAVECKQMKKEPKEKLQFIFSHAISSMNILPDSSKLLILIEAFFALEHNLIGN
jgi:hypothetical protein